MPITLKRNVIVEVVISLIRCALARSLLSGLLLSRLLLITFLPRIKQLHFFAYNLGAVTILPGLVLPFTRFDAALDIELAALVRVLPDDLRQLAKK